MVITIGGSRSDFATGPWQFECLYIIITVIILKNK